MVSSTKRYVVLNKTLGQTPLQAIDAWRVRHPEHASLSATYAGRLDPMATGLLLVLLDDECKKQKKYHGLDKEYEIEVLLDVETDTGDILGMPQYAGVTTGTQGLAAALASVTGTHTVPYPAFSSKTVLGKPLFQYAHERTLETIEIPVHDETVYDIRVLDIGTLSKEELSARTGDTLTCAPRTDDPSKALGTDFRQDAIRKEWTLLLASIPNRTFTLARLRVTCASGTYMRTLASRIAEELGTSGMTLSIRRTRIGKYAKIGPLGIWTQKYE